MNKKNKALFGLSIALNALLIIALTIGTIVFINQSSTAIQSNADPDGSVVSNPQEEEEVVPVSMLQQYAAEYNVSTEFLQKFFDDVIVYKGINGITYAEIDDSLPKNSYNWNNLVKTNGIYDYVENDVSVGKKGIDVSKYQGDIDWKKVKAAGIDYAIIRLGNRGYSTGKIVIDEKFEKNITNAIKNDIPVGVYFFSQAITEEEAIEEANVVLEAIKPYKISYPVVFDTEQVEDPNGRANLISKELRTDITIAFCDTVKQAGYHPMIYANTRWFVAELDLSRLASYDKWFAQYYKIPFFPYDFQMWQYTGRGTVDGITGNVDLNVSFVDYEAKLAGEQ